MQTSWEPITNCATGEELYPGMAFVGAPTHWLNPQMDSVYPEYITDLNVSFCPSSYRYTPEDLVNEVSGRSEGDLVCHEAIPGPSFNQFSRDRGLALMDESYWYSGYVFDTVENTAPKAPLSTLVTGSTLNGPAQLVYTMTGAIGGFFGGIIDEDLDLSSYGPGFGNAGGDTVYRLREGIERFLITDINNAATSNMAQSDVWIMTDRLNTVASEFNHVPGGANVLFQDGHVEFIRYGSQVPVTEGVAKTFGEITVHGS